MEDNFLIKKKEELLQRFKLDYQRLTGSYPNVKIFESKMQKILSLEELEVIINMHIPKELYERYSSIRVICRKRELVDLRFIFFYIAKKLGYPSTTISRYFKKDHSTVLNGWRKFDSYINTDEGFTNKYKVIISYINRHYKDGIRILYEPIKESVDSKSTLHPVLL